MNAQRGNRGDEGARASGVDAPAEPPRRAGTVALVGRPNVGKSTLLNAALDQPLTIVSPTPQTTRDAILGIVRHGGAEIALLDTPGLHRARDPLGRVMNRRAREAAREADVVVFVTDLPTMKGKADDARPLEPHRGDLALLTDIAKDQPAVLVVNKIDRVRDKARLLPLLEALGKVHPFEAVVPISATRADGVTRVLDEVAKLLPEGEARFGEDDLTDRPVKFFAGEYVREQILRATAEEVPHAAAVVVDRFHEPPGGGPFTVDATIHVERPGQKKILVGAGGSMLKRIGTNARLRIEELVARRVTLKLWVCVTPNWRTSTRHLAELGYDKEGDTPADAELGAELEIEADAPDAGGEEEEEDS
jgi:GTP-binding protein Era